MFALINCLKTAIRLRELVKFEFENFNLKI